MIILVALTFYMDGLYRLLDRTGQDQTGLSMYIEICFILRKKVGFLQFCFEWVIWRNICFKKIMFGTLDVCNGFLLSDFQFWIDLVKFFQKNKCFFFMERFFRAPGSVVQRGSLGIITSLPFCHSIMSLHITIETLTYHCYSCHRNITSFQSSSSSTLAPDHQRVKVQQLC